MKKTSVRVWMLCLAMVLLLSACGSVTQPTETTPVPALTTTASPETTAEPTVGSATTEPTSAAPVTDPVPEPTKTRLEKTSEILREHILLPYNAAEDWELIAAFGKIMLAYNEMLTPEETSGALMDSKVLAVEDPWIDSHDGEVYLYAGVEYAVKLYPGGAWSGSYVDGTGEYEGWIIWGGIWQFRLEDESWHFLSAITGGIVPPEGLTWHEVP